MTIYTKLLRLPFFQGIDRDELEAMASKIRFDFQKYDEGAWIARENDRCATLTLVMTGSVEAEAISADHSYSLREQIDALAKQTAALYGATADVEWTDITPALINPADFSADVQAQARKLEGVNVITNRPVSLGGDNFAEYQQKVPGVYAYLGTRDPENPNTALAHHNDGFDLGEKALPYGTALYAQVALWWLQEGAEQA